MVNNCIRTLYKKYGKQIEPYMFISPAFMILGFITLFPMIYVVYLSLYKIDLINPDVYIGLKNYTDFFRPVSLQTVKVTILYLLGSLFFTMVPGFLLALALNQKIRFSAFFRSISIVPWTITAVVAGVCWRWILSPDIGFLSYYIEKIFSFRPDFLYNPNWALLLIIIVDSWRSLGYVAVFILAGLQGIDPSLLEAARVDGADYRKIFRYIMLPLLTPSILVLLILMSMRALNMVDVVLVVTGGGPMRLTETLALHMYKESMSYFNIGYSSAVAVILLIINLVLAVVYFRMLGEKGGQS